MHANQLKCCKYLLLLFSFQLFFSHIVAQDSYQVSGKVNDLDGIPIEFAVVLLCQLPDSLVVNSLVSDSVGYFNFNEIKQGDFYLRANLNGYLDVVSSPFRISTTSPKATIDLKMNAATFVTEDIIIQGQKAKITQEAGKMVVDVENNVMNAGQSAADALSRIPGVTVDKDGKLRLKGKDGVMVMIDDKPMYLDATQLGSLLKALPADQLKQIEVMTSPNSKYDAAGTAGIINLKLKKGAYEGFDGTITSSAGRGVYPKANTGINVSYRKNKITLNGGYQYNYKENLHRFYVYRNYVTSQSSDSTFKTFTDASQPERTHTILFGGSYKVLPKGTLTWDMTTLKKNLNWNSLGTSRITSSAGNEVSYFETVNRSREKGYNGIFSLGYKHQIDTSGTELSVLGNYNLLQKTSFENQSTFYKNSTIQPSFYRAEIPIWLNQGSAQLDFTKNIFKDFKLETGYKFNSIVTESKVTNTLQMNNHFLYDEKINAFYAQLHKSFGKWKLQGGVRVESTNNVGSQKSTDSTFRRSYTNLFPSANISYKLSEKTSYAFLYTRRIERPFYESMNPFIYFNDPYTRYAGNPFLLPQYTEHTELTFSGWKGVLLTTINYSYTTQPLADIFIFDNNSLVTTYTKTNLKSRISTGISFSVNLPVTKWWSTTNFLLINNNRQAGNVGYGETKFNLVSWSYNGANTFKLPYKFSAELSGNYESRSFWGNNFYNELWQIGMGVSKKILKDRFTVKLSATDLFWKYHYNGKGTFGNIRMQDGYKWDNRVVMFTLTYHLRKKIIPDESDIKK